MTKGGLTLRAACCAVAAVIGLQWTEAAQAADLPKTMVAKAAPPPTFDAWTYDITPYAWMPSLNGTSTVRNHVTDVDATFIDLLHRKIPKELFGLMTAFEARNGRFALLGDFVYMKLGVSKSGARSVSLGPVATDEVGAALDLNIKMAVGELALAYELARWGASPGAAGSGTAIDIYGGGRFWWQRVDLDLTVTDALALVLPNRGFEIAGGRAIARSGDVTWADPLVGLRLRHQISPGHDLMLSGDIGGFGVGSDLSWQVIGAYRWAFAKSHGILWSGMIGYRALSVDFSKGAGPTRYEYDMLQHGPIMGVSMRF